MKALIMQKIVFADMKIGRHGGHTENNGIDICGVQNQIMME